jgi:hypothetical protein
LEKNIKKKKRAKTKGIEKKLPLRELNSITLSAPTKGRLRTIIAAIIEGMKSSQILQEITRKYFLNWRDMH